MLTEKNKSAQKPMALEIIGPRERITVAGVTLSRQGRYSAYIDTIPTIVAGAINKEKNLTRNHVLAIRLKARAFT